MVKQAKGVEIVQPVWRAFSLWVLLLVLLAGCSSHEVKLTCPTPTVPPPVTGSCFSLKKDFDGMVDRELLPYTTASIKVVSLKSGATLYEKNPRLLMPAASLQKLFTAAAALSLLGPDHAIETSIAVNSDNDVLYVKGCGDPLLKTADLAHLVGVLAGKLSPGGCYKLVGDTGCFDDAYWGKGWMWDDEPEPDAMYLSALTVNGNTIRVTAFPGKNASSPLVIATNPETGYVIIENAATTGKKGGPCTASITRSAGDHDNFIHVAGSLAPGCPAVSKRLTVWRPERYFLTLLAERLERAGIEPAAIAFGNTPADATLLAATRHSVGQVVSAMLKKSDNVSAENLLKYLAHVISGQKGTADRGAGTIKKYLRSKGIPTDHLVIVDGSGVSRYNLTSADTITRLLVTIYKDPSISSFFMNALPLAGNDGTLARRMKRTPCEGRLKAKTGTMKGISALAGYTVTADGEPLAFTMIMQNFVGSDKRIRDLQDRMAVLLSTLTSGRKDCVLMRDP
ncbi:MAG TPA: D-alanyl-D-alanine carboxypeptidase/D-alanyl-D-alanine-endopeptidase [Geobacteraceae bacterium]|nr:D-alanyl-D-alanine carboxypeptidase/D-alanyl-D-alanine-endopeptidase [Geobacteraceae bacterium]